MKNKLLLKLLPKLLLKLVVVFYYMIYIPMMIWTIMTVESFLEISLEGDDWTFNQPNDFVAGNKVYRLIRNGLNQYHYFYICSLLNKQIVNYSYSNARIPEKIKNEIISLPITLEDDIDFAYMESYIRAIQKLVIADVVKYKNSVIETTKQVVNV